jgi:hypothetical protein
MDNIVVLAVEGCLIDGRWMKRSSRNWQRRTSPRRNYGRSSTRRLKIWKIRKEFVDVVCRRCRLKELRASSFLVTECTIRRQSTRGAETIDGISNFVAE